MAQNKTVPSDQSVEQFLNSLEGEQKRKDSFSLLELMKEVTGLEPKMWGSSIVGFGSIQYKYESEREGEMILVGFSPRKQNLTLYGIGSLEEYGELGQKLGKFTTGKSCLFIKTLNDIDITILKRLLAEALNRKPKAEL